MKILMVCLGNICRSPIAEGILQHKCKEYGIAWHVDSAGTNGYHNGEPPHHMSQHVSKLNGVDISHQRSRTFKAEDFDTFDLIIPMAVDVMREMKYIAREKYDSDKVKLLLDYLFPEATMDVPDPWGRSEAAFHEVYELIEGACEAMISNHTSKKQP
ncbi:MAG: low molecular weight protein-tyrosine-phosphatase [bacterium]|jgi:protein-tyrosine phosphatase